MKENALGSTVLEIYEIKGLSEDYLHNFGVYGGIWMKLSIGVDIGNISKRF